MINAFESVVEQFLEREMFSGVILLARDGQPLYQRACGQASRMTATANRMETRFGTASLTKMFTAAAVVKQIEAGAYDWETSVTGFLGLGESAISPEVTVRQLLTHTSGISDYTDEEDPMGFENLWKAIGPCAVKRPGQLLPFFMDEAPHQPPGAGFEYSNAGYILLGLMLEKASGMPFDEVIRRQVFQKAGMNYTDFIPMTRVAQDLAEGYMPVRDGENRLLGWERNIYSIPAYGLPDGGAFSTAWDLVHFMRALRSGRLFGEAMTQTVLRPQVQVDRNWQYGCGLWFDVEEGRILRYGHTGEDPGVSARVYHYPLFNLDLVILGNQSYCAGDLDWQLHHLIMEEAARLADQSAS